MSRNSWFLVLALCLPLAACGAPDGDGDSLSDTFEALIGTNPELGDSDGDGVTDAQEYLAYFDPLDRDDVPYVGGYPRQPLPEEFDGAGWNQGQISKTWLDGDTEDSEASTDRHGDLLDSRRRTVAVA